MGIGRWDEPNAAKTTSGPSFLVTVAEPATDHFHASEHLVVVRHVGHSGRTRRRDYVTFFFPTLDHVPVESQFNTLGPDLILQLAGFS